MQRSFPAMQGKKGFWLAETHVQSRGMKDLACGELQAVWQKARLVDWAR